MTQFRGSVSAPHGSLLSCMLLSRSLRPLTSSSRAHTLASRLSSVVKASRAMSSAPTPSTEGLDFYSVKTPNGLKINIALEELNALGTAIKWKEHSIDFSKNEQKGMMTNGIRVRAPRPHSTAHSCPL